MIDQFSNISGVNDMNASKIKTAQMILNNSIFFTQSGVNAVSQNNNNYGEFQWKGNSGWTLAFNPPSGQLGGMNNIVSHILETKYIKFRDITTFQLTGSEIYQSGRDIIIKNGNVPGSFLLKHKTTDNIENVLSINEFMNMAGINDINMNGKLRINNNAIEHKYENNIYVIDNKNAGSSIQIRNYDGTGVLKQIQMDQYMNMSGVNDLYVQRIFFNNVLFNPTSYNDIVTKTRNLYSYNQDQTSIEYNNGRFIFYPGANNKSSINPIIQNNDQAMVAYNIMSGFNHVLTLCTWTNNQTGVRITNNEVQMHKPKVMDNLTFNDNTVQTTAMTESYLTPLIQSVVNQMQLSPPVGTILTFSGEIAPTDYLFCQGTPVLISSYPTLYGVIGNKFIYNNTPISGKFYLPDLRGAYLKGINTPMLFTNKEPISQIGQIQQCNVGNHSHKYNDRGSGERVVIVNAVGSSGTVANNTDGFFYTDGYAYDSNTQNQLNAETRPNSVGILYIIKY
jgi:microcystin-dependent protein